MVWCIGLDDPLVITQNTVHRSSELTSCRTAEGWSTSNRYLHKLSMSGTLEQCSDTVSTIMGVEISVRVLGGVGAEFSKLVEMRLGTPKVHS